MNNPFPRRNYYKSYMSVILPPKTIQYMCSKVNKNVELRWTNLKHVHNVPFQFSASQISLMKTEIGYSVSAFAFP